jgi:uncharacterized protein
MKNSTFPRLPLPATLVVFGARRLALVLLVGLTATLGGSLLSPAMAQDPRQDQPQNLPTVTLRAGFHNVVAQVARTNEQRQIGLMFRASMPVNEGMLFVFDEPSPQCFWMKNTLLPLAIAFVSDDGTIVNIDEMKPQTLNSHCSTKPVRYVLEMNTGWFAKKGLKAGDRLSGGPFSATPTSQGPAAPKK